MKLLTLVFFCFTLVALRFKIVNSGVVLDFLEKAHERAHERAEKARDNFRNMFDLNKRENKTATDNSGKNTSYNQTPVTETVARGDSADTAQYSNKQKTETAIVFPTDETIISTTDRVTTTTDKDGRENFSGGCEPGYQRTTDGRCMPTY